MSQNMETMQTPAEMLRKFTRELPVVLNDHELQTYGKMLAEKCKEQELALDKKKQVTADHNNRIKVITNEIKRIADARAKGEELRPVQCGERLRGNVIEIVRLDRHEIVDTRPADLRDLQQNLPGVPEAPSDFDEGPRGDDFGGPDKTGREVDPRVQNTPGSMSTSSSGDVVYTGAPDDEASAADGYDMPAQPDGDGDEEATFPTDDDESDTPSEALKLAECASCGEAVTEEQTYEVVGSGRLVHGGCLLQYQAKGAKPEAVKPARDRSRKSNEAKGTSKSGKGKRKK